MGTSLDTDSEGGFDLATFYMSSWGRGDETVEGDPLGHSIYPVFEDLSREGDVVAIIVIFTLWRQLFLDILPPDAVGVVVFLENTCEQVSPALKNMLCLLVDRVIDIGCSHMQLRSALYV